MTSVLANDLKFSRFFHLSLHIIIILFIIKLFFNSILEYQLLDDQIRQKLFVENFNLNNNDVIVVDQLLIHKCLNVSIIVEDFIDKKNDSARFIIFYIILLMTIISSIMLMIIQNWILLSLFLIFQTMILIVNLFAPIILLSSYTNVVILLTSYCLNLFCFIFKIRLHFYDEKYANNRNNQNQLEQRPEISEPILLNDNNSNNNRLVQFNRSTYSRLPFPQPQQQPQQHQQQPPLPQHRQLSTQHYSNDQIVPFLHSTFESDESRTTF